MKMNHINAALTVATCMVLQYVCWFVALPYVFSKFMQNQSVSLGILCNLAVAFGCLGLYLWVCTVYRYCKGRPY